MSDGNRVDLAPDIVLVQQVVERNFPGLWPTVDLTLTTAATLLLTDNSNPSAVFFVGGHGRPKRACVNDKNEVNPEPSKQ